jgi:hypothetical protein
MAPADKDQSEMLAKTDFVELAADKWLRSQKTTEPASLILYHLINIAMHANLLVVQNYAHKTSKGQVETSEMDRDHSKAYILRWICGKHYQIAEWHAKRILECVGQHSNVSLTENSTSARHHNGRSQPLNPASEASSQGGLDIAHVPYAIYYATLILWCGRRVAFDAAEGTTTTATAMSCLERGRNLLSRQRLRIATLLEHVLRKVDMRGNV